MCGDGREARRHLPELVQGRLGERDREAPHRALGDGLREQARTFAPSPTDRRARHQLRGGAHGQGQASDRALRRRQRQPIWRSTRASSSRTATPSRRRRSSARSQALPEAGLTSLFKFVRLLSGKPMTQGPHDLWAQLTRSRRPRASRYYGWQARFCQLGGWENRQVVGMLNEDMLQKPRQRSSFQAKKKDWLKGLPEKVYTTRTLRASGRCSRTITMRWRKTSSPTSRASASRSQWRSPSGRRSADPVRLRHQRRRG